MLLRSLLELVLPRFCMICGRRLEVGEDYICLHCNIALPRTYHWESPTDNELAKRFYGRLPLEKAASFIYHVPKTSTAAVIYDFKYHRDFHLAYQVGKMMAQEIGSDFFSGIDGIVPVPISWWREFRRGGYNQSEKIAKGISRITGIKVCKDVIVKAKGTVSQTTLSHTERVEALDGAFRLHKHAKRYEGKHLLIVDDVVTTGATTIACGTVMLGIKDVKLSVLSYSCIKYIS